MSMDDYITQYLEQFDIDQTALGDLVDEGTQHYVYSYRQGQVIKIPKHSLAVSAMGRMQAEDIMRDLEILEQYLPEHLVYTRVLCAENGCYAVVQEILKDARLLTCANLSRVRDDFIHIVETNKQIVRDHCLTLDLLGSAGFWRCLTASALRRKNLASINNLLVVNRNGDWTIKIVDCNLTQPYMRCSKGVSALRLVIDSAYFQIARFLIKDNFGVNA
jgi:hypothetical protein